MEEYFDVLIILSFLLGGLMTWFLTLRSNKQIKMNNDELLERLKLDEIQVAELNRIQQTIMVEKAKLETELRLINKNNEDQHEFANQLAEFKELITKLETKDLNS